MMKEFLCQEKIKCIKRCKIARNISLSRDLYDFGLFCIRKNSKEALTNTGAHHLEDGGSLSDGGASFLGNPAFDYLMCILTPIKMTNLKYRKQDDAIILYEVNLGKKYFSYTVRKR